MGKKYQEPLVLRKKWRNIQDLFALPLSRFVVCRDYIVYFVTVLSLFFFLNLNGFKMKVESEFLILIRKFNNFENESFLQTLKEERSDRT